MKYLLLTLFLLPISLLGQVRPDQAPLVNSPDTSNFEVYGQKGGSLRRTTLDRLGAYVFDNLTISYDQALNRVYLTGFGTDIDSIDLADAAVTASLADTILTINDIDIDLSSFDNSFTWSPSTYTLILNRAGTNDTISLAGLSPALSYDSNSLSLILGTDSTDVSQLRQELSYNDGTGVLTLSNGGGSVTLDVDGLTAIVAASYFGGSGTAGDPLTIDDGGLTFTKIQNINNGSILGRYSVGTGVIQELTLGSGFTVTSSGVINFSSDSINVIGLNVIDTTFSSDGTDLASAFFTGLLGSNDEINLDAVLEVGASSNLIISLPSAAAYEGKNIYITNVDFSSDYRTVISNVANAGFSSQYFMRNGEALRLKAMSLDGTISWVAVSSSEAYSRKYSAGAGVIVSSDNLGITASKVAGVVTVSIPSNVNISSFRFYGTSSDLNSGEITFDFVGGYGSGTDYNTSNANLFYPTITMQQRTVAPGADYEQRPHDAGGFQIFHEAFATSGTVSVKITNISGSFGVFGQF